MDAAGDRGRGGGTAKCERARRYGRVGEGERGRRGEDLWGRARLYVRTGGRGRQDGSRLPVVYVFEGIEIGFTVNY